MKLRLGTVHCQLLMAAQLLALRKALAYALEDFVEEMKGPQAAVTDAARVLRSARAKQKQLELRCLDRQATVQVCGLAGPLGDVYCDRGSTIFHVKELIQTELGVPVNQQTLLCGVHNLQDEDVLRWFQRDELEVVMLTLVKSKGQISQTSGRRNEDKEFESAHRAIADAEEQLKNARWEAEDVSKKCGGGVA